MRVRDSTFLQFFPRQFTPLASSCTDKSLVSPTSGRQQASKAAAAASSSTVRSSPASGVTLSFLNSLLVFFSHCFSILNFFKFRKFFTSATSLRTTTTTAAAATTTAESPSEKRASPSVKRCLEAAMNGPESAGGKSLKFEKKTKIRKCGCGAYYYYYYFFVHAASSSSSLSSSSASGGEDKRAKAKFDPEFLCPELSECKAPLERLLAALSKSKGVKQILHANQVFSCDCMNVYASECESKCECECECVCVCLFVCLLACLCTLTGLFVCFFAGLHRWRPVCTNLRTCANAAERTCREHSQSAQ